ncbi:pyridoxal 4-dehydrogenase, SDR-type [Subtercola boreus]|uniref:Pyridoxal 4-dehydrogenase n=1 Tax=Subtercola boreus TaxID=120213 RepID=A0A3E0WEB3_9MICO|nr:SDR family NAD(P)-dependent oxidoreductase [Subtercola boreus]RFA23682.1 pyridoxal 4-dehydrogenase [Subtercola boreus]RFA24074.1 pyridoxal 4-dehydrogenase [Subtercola boreus]RFA29458.1 pyridoxal 4-dehydrogenase [Subtercola boreus]
MPETTQRVALVTGAAQGIGAAIADELAADGMLVVVADVNLEGAEAVAARNSGVAKLLDVSDPERVQAVVDEIVAEFGRIDVLVNNAALVPLTPWAEISFEEWRKVMSVNLDGIYLTTHAVTAVMGKAGYGRIVNIASNTFVAGTPDCAHYVATKGASIGLVRGLAGELGPLGITINAVAPGIIASEGVLSGPHEAGFEFVVPMQAINRRGLPRDVAPAVAFLASEKAAWITGQTLVVDAGHTRN